MSRKTVHAAFPVILAVIISLLGNIVTGGRFIPLGPAWLLLVVAVLAEVVLAVFQAQQNTPSVVSRPSHVNRKRRSFLQFALISGFLVGGGSIAIWKLRAFFEAKQGTPSASTTASLLVYTGQSGQIVSISWSPDGKHLASCETPWNSSGDTATTIKVWDTTIGQTIQTYMGHQGSAYAVAWSPDGVHIASGGSPVDGTIQIWEAFTGKRLFTLKLGKGVTGVAWSPDGKRIVSASTSIQIWNTITGELLSTFLDSQYCYDVTWSSDGKYIATTGYNDKLTVWEATEKLIFTTTSRESPIALSFDNKYVIAAARYLDSHPYNIQVWSFVNGARLAFIPVIRIK